MTLWNMLVDQGCVQVLEGRLQECISSPRLVSHMACLLLRHHGSGTLSDDEWRVFAVTILTNRFLLYFQDELLTIHEQHLEPGYSSLVWWPYSTSVEPSCQQTFRRSLKTCELVVVRMQCSDIERSDQVPVRHHGAVKPKPWFGIESRESHGFSRGGHRHVVPWWP